jgi:glutathione peroxidase
MIVLLAALAMTANSVGLPLSAAQNPTQNPGQTPPAQNPTQNPGQKPPGQTPPGQTPPGQTPPAQTPPGTAGTTGTTGTATQVGPTPTTNQSVYGFTATDINGNVVSLSSYQGKSIIFVNTGSYSVLANQLRDLNSLYQADSARIVVLAFPSNDFNHENNETNLQIAQRYHSAFGVTFPIFAPTHVTGAGISPLYQFLVNNGPKPGTPIEGDYVKFVTDHQGRIIARLRPNDTPLSLNFQLATQGIR